MYKKSPLDRDKNHLSVCMIFWITCSFGMTRSSSCPGRTWPLVLFLQPFSHVYLAGQQRNHSWFMHSPWRGTALITYPSKGTKCHCEITFEFLTPDKTYPETEGEWELGPVLTLSYVQDGGLVDTSSQCKASFAYCICNKSFLFYHPTVLTVHPFMTGGFIYSALKDSEITGHIDTTINCSSYAKIYTHGQAPLLVGIYENYAGC